MQQPSPRLGSLISSTLCFATVATSLSLSTSLSGCAAFQRKNEAESSQEKAAAAPQEPDMRTQMIAMGTRLDALETKLASLNDKFDATKVSIDNFLTTQKLKTEAALPHPAAGGGKQVEVTEAPEAPSDPEAGFAHDDAVQSYRQAMVLYSSKKFPEASLAFSKFLETYPDHPLAGSAQFRLGDSYFQQKEFKLSVQEFQRVLTSYDRSPHVAETLKEMALAEDALKRTEDAARHRQLLHALFPQSPAAAGMTAPAPSVRKGAQAKAHSATSAPSAPSAAPAHDAEPNEATSSSEAHEPGAEASTPTAPLENSEK